MDNVTTLQIGYSSLKYFKPKYAEEELKKSGKSPDLRNKLETSDLCSGEYEGGFKVWECSLDLCRYLASPNETIIDMNDKRKRVLDLGCGAGLLGIAFLRLYEVEHVCFQDLNEEVLNFWTKPNVELNGACYLPKCKFIAGDWSTVENLTDDIKFDLILTSETIYDGNNYLKLHECLDKTLADDGMVLLAAKTYYFGCSGSIPSFLPFVKDEEVFDYKIAWTSENAGIPRKIIELKRRVSGKGF